MGLVNGRPDNIGTLLEEAQSIHTRGYNCAETALWALAKYWQLHCSTSYVTGLGGGVARSGETCGALTGAIVALGLKVGRTEPEDEEKKGLCYRFGQEIVRRFRDEIGTTQCREIIGFTLGRMAAHRVCHGRWEGQMQSGQRSSWPHSHPDSEQQ